MESKRRFFISVVPGMETVAYLELCERLAQAPFFLPAPQVTHFKGGIEVELETAQGLALNFYMRLSNRILMRALQFDSPRISFFKKQMATFPWKSFFRKDVQLQFTSRSSKLSVKKQIIRELEPMLKKQGLRWSSEGPSLFVRLFRDECEVSVDTTGARGQFRGQGKEVGAASLRDTTAAGLLRLLFQGVELNESITLVDPMAGSGTFLLEGLDYKSPLRRSFVCESFPVFDSSLVPNMEEATVPSWKVFGIEKDEKTAEKGRRNFSQHPEARWQWVESDFRDVSDIPENSFMIINPPWGKRIPKDQNPHWFSELLAQWKPGRVGILWNGGRLPEHNGYQMLRHLWLENSGLRNQFAILLPKK